MQQATITVSFVNPPRGNGPGSVKDTNGKLWRVWPTSKKPGGAVLANFQAGGTYSVGYSSEDWKGEEQRTITSVTQTAAAQAPQAAPKSNGYARQPTDPTDAERMFTCSILNAFVESGKVELAAIELVEATNLIRHVWQQTFGADVR